MPACTKVTEVEIAQARYDLAISSFQAGLMSNNQGFILRPVLPALLNFKSPSSRASDMVKRMKKRSWPFEKFAVACRNRAKRLGVRIDATKLRAAYDNKWSIPYAVEALKR